MAEDDPTSSANTHGTQVAQRHYEPNGQGELTTAIIYAIAEADGVSPREVKSPPLYDSVDVPAIEKAFFRPNVGAGSRQGVGTVEFQYTDYLVKVQSDGWVRVYDPTEADHS
ncbi:hypothetical protein AV929_20655 [Haloarcula sp. K1]|nr:hypothetical protein AV929_20655 [Haloarcula sp. K1]